LLALQAGRRAALRAASARPPSISISPAPQGPHMLAVWLPASAKRLPNVAWVAPRFSALSLRKARRGADRCVMMRRRHGPAHGPGGSPQDTCGRRWTLMQVRTPPRCAVCANRSFETAGRRSVCQLPRLCECAWQGTPGVILLKCCCCLWAACALVGPAGGCHLCSLPAHSARCSARAA